MPRAAARTLGEVRLAGSSPRARSSAPNLCRATARTAAS
ncbi:uncharacterized protein SOCE26_004930 [Sorangium cellulosum]|uniref:Uncharacterized protein n=1 Tax=Sorangium cellulosum TaxID=56 RepID=A0A2L0EII9_SORCE|nr:uncharacterized protein SOCE26_004930 [Sorangium cellulosum]